MQKQKSMLIAIAVLVLILMGTAAVLLLSNIDNKHSNQEFFTHISTQPFIDSDMPVVNDPKPPEIDDSEPPLSSQPDTMNNEAEEQSVSPDDAGTIESDSMILDESGIFAAGDGTEEFPYIIITAEQLSNVRSDLSAYYKLGGNIDLNDEPFEIIGFGEFSNSAWNAKQGFQGVFDGGGYAIIDLRIDSQSQCSGLFAAVGSNGIIRNLLISGQARTTLNNVNNAIGILTGYNCGLIEHCSALSTVLGSGKYAMVGGIVGTNEGTVQFCDNTGYVHGKGEYVKTGGVVGINLPDGIVNECTGNADIKSEYRAGEVVGWNEGIFN